MFFEIAIAGTVVLLAIREVVVTRRLLKANAEAEAQAPEPPEAP